MISVTEAVALVTFTSSEERAIAKLEAAIDASLHEKFNGAPFKLEFQEVIDPKIAHAIQRKYEEGGGWRVGVTHAPLMCAFSFLPTYAAVSTAKPTEAKLPLVATAKPKLMQIASGKRLLVRFPTRGRPTQALAVLEKYRTMAGVPVTIEVILDDDDTSMLAADVLQRLIALDCVVTVQSARGKIAACNGGRAKDWDVLVLASDDMVPVVDSYAARVLAAMEKHFPYLDGAIYFSDGHHGANLCTLPIMGRRLVEQFGYVYYPEYQSLFSDTEQTVVLKALGRLTYVDETIIEHRHYVWGTAPKDALYHTNETYWDVDKAAFERRFKTQQPLAQIPFDSPPLWLTICIATLPIRRARLEHLLDHLWQQILDFTNPVGDEHARMIEVVVDDREGPTVGEKRQALLERARGHFVAFVDDDDWVAPDYVRRVVEAIGFNPQADCASLVGVMTTAGAVPEHFAHSIKNAEWRTDDGIHLRTPNHLNAVRTSLALKVGFKAVSKAEDFDYSKRLQPLLKQEASTGDAPLYYYFYWPGKEPGA